MGTTNNVIPFLLIASAIVDLNASIAAILNATTPLFTALVATVWLKEPLGWRKTTGLLLGVVGVSILMGWSPLPLSSTVIWAALFALVGALSYAVAAVYARHTFGNTRPVAVAMGQLWGSALLLFPLTAISLPERLPSTTVLVAVIALALVSTAFAYLLYFQLIAGLGATQAATVTFLVPIFSLLWGVLLLGEPITPGLIIGLAVILLAIWLVLYPKK